MNTGLKASLSAAAALLLLLATACSGDSGSEAVADAGAANREISARDFDPANFDRSTTIDN
ncbi:MAG TPA: hypothetical protein VE615_08780, partial [Gaiellaceae bacterium]|nr:hypothetical protein [Gaiellaceae bacterium]